MAKNVDALEMLRRIEELSPAKCKRCPQPRVMVADKSAMSMKHYDKTGKNLTVVSHGLVPHPSGLCYFHLKEELGLISKHRKGLKYPLSGPSPEIKDVWKENPNGS